MIQRRQWLLQQLGITQLLLRRPEALKGLAGSPLLGSSLCLVLVADPLPLLSTPLLQDVLQTLQLTEQRVHCCTPSQLAQQPPAPLYWSLGQPIVDPWRPMIVSAPLDQLLSSAAAKRQLWQQICHYVDLPATPL